MYDNETLKLNVPFSTNDSDLSHVFLPLHRDVLSLQEIKNFTRGKARKFEKQKRIRRAVDSCLTQFCLVSF